MREETIKITCDIHNCSDDAKGAKVQVIFLTEQTEGRSTDPYLQIAKIDLCENCYKNILKGAAIFATGAQGYNTYKFNQQSSE